MADVMTPVPVPDEWVDKAFLLLADFDVPGESPQMRALLENQLQVAAGATRTQKFSEFARETGTVISPTYNPISPEVVTWARANSSLLVKQVTDATRRGIAEVIAQSIYEMRGVEGAKRLVRERLLADKLSQRMGMMAGLDANRIKSVLNYEESLLTNGYSPKDAERMARTYAKRQLNARSKTIAQTEMRRSVESAQLEAEKEMGAKEKQWGTSGDNRVSDVCVNNKAAGWIKIDDRFPSGHQTPAAHPNCRSYLNFRRQAFEKTVADLRRRGVLAPVRGK